MKQKFTFLMVLLMVCMGVSAQTEKFYVGVTGYDGETAKTVDATVYDDYSFNVKLPAADADGKCYIGADKAKIDIRMTNVASLGLAAGETRSASKTLETGVSGVTADLCSALSNAYGFQGVDCPITVKDENTTKTFDYKITPCLGNVIYGVPSSTEDARAAWMLLTSKVTASTKSEDDSFFGFKKGTYVRFGDEDLIFDADLDLLKGAWTIDGIFTDVENAVHIANNGLTGANTYKPVVFLPAGSLLSLSSSQAVLNYDATITVDGTAAYEEGNELTGVISTYRTQMNNDTKMAIYLFMTLFNEMIGLVDDANNVPVTVDFAPVGTLTVYKGNSTAVENVPVTDWAGIQAEYPNAIAIAESSLESWASSQTNVVVKYAAGKYGNYYYECPDLVLADKQNFYTPVNFNAVSGSYSRAIYSNSNTACVPFAVDKSMIENSSAKILSFAYYKPNPATGHEFVYFNDVQTLSAGVPCLLYCTSDTKLNATFDNTEIVANPINDYNMKGTYVMTSDLKSDYTYGLNSDGSQFAPLASTVSPFRCVLSLHYDTELNDGDNNHEDGVAGAKALKIAIIGEDGEATAIDGTPVATSAKSAIYTINGVKVNEAKTAGLYIINGKKTFIK